MAKALASKSPDHQIRTSPIMVYLLYGLNLVIITFFWWRGSHLESHTFHGMLTIFGRYTGLVSAYAALWQLLLIGRMPVIKQALGIEQEFKLHRWNGYAAIYLLLAHIVLLTAGYAIAGRVNLWAQFIDFVFNYEDIFKATIGSALMIGLVVMTIVIIRRQFKYETWYLIHLSSYLAIVLAFGHQLATGGDFIRQPGFALYWQSLYVLVFGLVVLVRLALPLWTWQQQHFRVEKVVEEAKGIYSIYISGRYLHQFIYQPGQFAIWHFLFGVNGWQGHPFSFSSHPSQDGLLRITVKNVGDYTSQLKNIKPGTPVILEGPFGNFTPQHLHQDKVLLVAGGIGLTPLISMLPELINSSRDTILIYAAQNKAELAMRQELDSYEKSGVKVYYVTDDGSLGAPGRLDSQKLIKLVPDVSSREVFLCGPPPMMAAVRKVLENQGVPSFYIHSERFSLHTT